MKKVMSTDMVAHTWAHQSQPEARNAQRSVYFNGPTIYSYGSHFPMARHVAGVVLMTTASYSFTTSRHQGCVHCAASHLTRYYVPNVLADSERAHMENMADYQRRYEEMLTAAGRARSNAEWRIERAEEIRNEANRYAEHFNLPAQIEPADIAELVERAKQETAKKRAETIEYKKRQAERHDTEWREHLESVEAWRNGERDRPESMSWANPHRVSTGAFLRVRGDTVQTSQGAEFPVADVAPAWAMIRRCKARNAEWQRNGEKVRLGSFQLDRVDADGNVKAGCHTVSYAECERLAETLGLIRDVSAPCPYEATYADADDPREI